MPTNPGTPRAKRRELLSQTVLDGIYRLESKYNDGELGEIWRARHLQLETEWLVKLLPLEFAKHPAYMDALLREAKVIAGLPGGYFPLVVHAGICDGVAFYVMEAMSGQCLTSLLNSDYPQGMPCSEALPLLEQILEAMSVAHEKGVIHRDIRAENIFVETTLQNSRRVRILDFGLAKVKHEVFATLGTSVPSATQRYAPPELHQPIPDAASPTGDVFAIGLVAYQMILGRHPFGADDHLKLYQEERHIRPLVVRPEGKRACINADVSEVLAKALLYEPAERFLDASVMLRALRFAQEFRPEYISVGTVLSNSYRVLGKLGKGGMSAIYEVEDIHWRNRGQHVLKILTLPQGCSEMMQRVLRERFRRECEVLHSLQHEAIPYIIGNASHQDYPYLVMERAKGDTFDKSFHSLLASGGWNAVFKMAKQVASALDAVHELDVIHRDIKPANIIVDPKTAQAMVLDFGIAFLQDTGLTANLRMGTPGFSSPEQITGHTLPASDQWSLAACFYALLMGLRPGTRPGEEEELDQKELSILADERISADMIKPFDREQALVDVPVAVANAIAKAMSFEVEDRFPSVSAFVEAMEDGIDRSEANPVSLRPSSVVAAGEGEHARSAYVDQVLRVGPWVLLLLALGVAGAVLWIDHGPRKNPTSAAQVPVVVEVPASVPAVASTVVDAGENIDANPIVQVSTSFNGSPLMGIKLRIGEELGASPFAIDRPLGEFIIHVDDSKYRGDYGCAPTVDASLCEVQLVRRKSSKRRRRRQPSDDASLFIFFPGHENYRPPP